MILCPVCEHPQEQGDECDNCGKKLVARPEATVATAPIPELEATQVALKGLPVQAERLAELELTSLPGGPDLPEQPVPDLEMTRMQAVGTPPPEIVADLETGRAADDGVRTEVSQEAVVCRYCRTPNPLTNALCERCGMRLQKVSVGVSATKGTDSQLAEGWIHCRDCGTPVESGKACRNCGARAGTAE